MKKLILGFLLLNSVLLFGQIPIEYEYSINEGSYDIKNLWFDEMDGLTDLISYVALDDDDQPIYKMYQFEFEVITRNLPVYDNYTYLYSFPYDINEEKYLINFYCGYYSDTPILKIEKYNIDENYINCVLFEESIEFWGEAEITETFFLGSDNEILCIGFNDSYRDSYDIKNKLLVMEFSVNEVTLIEEVNNCGENSLKLSTNSLISTYTSETFDSNFDTGIWDREKGFKIVEINDDLTISTQVLTSISGNKYENIDEYGNSETSYENWVTKLDILSNNPISDNGFILYSSIRNSNRSSNITKYSSNLELDWTLNVDFNYNTNCRFILNEIPGYLLFDHESLFFLSEDTGITDNYQANSFNPDFILKKHENDYLLLDHNLQDDLLVTYTMPSTLVENQDFTEINPPSTIKCYPNPFNPTINSRSNLVTISYELPEKIINPKIEIYNLKGQIVESIPVSKNQKNVSWDGKNIKGDVVASGIYFYQLKGENFSSCVEKIVVLR